MPGKLLLVMILMPILLLNDKRVHNSAMQEQRSHSCLSKKDKNVSEWETGITTWKKHSPALIVLYYLMSTRGREQTS